MRQRLHYIEGFVTVSVMFVVIVTIALVCQTAVLAAGVAGKLARLDGASYPTALVRAAGAFAAVVTVAAAVAAAIAPYVA